MSRSMFLLSAVAVLPLVRCIEFSPAPTKGLEHVDKAGNGWTPVPTQGPSVAELRRRQLASTLGDGLNTCGWIATDFDTAGNFSTPVICSTGRTCALYTASNIGMAGCCSGGDTQNCGWGKSCVNYDAYTKKSCDTDCELNPFIWKCSKAATPYCVTWTYPDAGVADYACATYNSGILTVLQTATDETSVYWKTLETFSGDAVTGWDDTATSETSDLFPESTPTTTDKGPSETPGLVTPTPSPRPPKKKSTPIGAIVGGVVGGLAVLALLAGVLIFVCLKNRKSKQLAANQPLMTTQHQQQEPPPPAAEYKPPMQQQTYASPPAGVHSGAPPQNGYFSGAQDQKINYQVQEQGMQSPVLSSPSTPAPPYVQPYYTAPNAQVPPIPSEGAVQYPAREPAEGTYEVDAITAHQGSQGRASQPGNVYEMGGPGR
ncbi:hypothetical protein BU23DRAFT_548827 [Bimuria novae-zelandiae CBS 107.79]|uniref:Mid2 domain-containing protein n=1 Tax=Bimuria novae-zelandiae CBS 107.79 TaxID=1447943 RepID=A0A6A5VXJ7_9PLEO|nr:hypothetical protein BU23DRAFT_548827 [Bimuria novae-zelandiae CBS 107.79]